jgi:uncharacterized protein YegP (UPF0339 family)
VSDNQTIHVYKAADGYRWRKVTSSDVTADSGEAYDEKADAVEAAESEAEGTPYTVVIDPSAVE